MLPRWLIRFRAFALACAFAAAFVPIATYITDDKRDWLWIHIGVNIAAYIAVALTTIYTTVSLTQQDHNKYRVPAYWANNVVMRTWYLGVSKTWRWHVAAVVGRLGLALALAQYLHIIIINDGPNGDFRGILAPFFYWSHTFYPPQAISPQLETAMIGFIVLVGFAYLETALIAAFTLLGYTIEKRTYKAVIVALALRAVIILVIIGMMSCIYTFTKMVGKDDTSYRTELLKDNLRQVHKVAFTLLDNGIMLSTWIMRPVGENISHACFDWVTGSIPSLCAAYDNRALVAFDGLMGLFAFLSYVLMISLCLPLAQYLHWRREQRELPPPRRQPLRNSPASGARTSLESADQSRHHTRVHTA
jgi:hypothetical protein